ncbi:MAG: NAD(P)/FAD-dependent oxidoreductase [Thermoleophilia bacterium]|nr:NAD(P)/FAD-dependent oxidoreductase [Thermoleophilia bacterium]
MKIVVLGGGSSGEHFVGAYRRLDTEAELTVVERRLVGGECSYYACIPTKTMLRAPELAASAHHSDGAVEVGALNVQRIFAWRDWVAERDDTSQVKWLASQNASLVRGDGVVAKPGLVVVGGDELRYDRLVIATGSTPAIPAIDGLASVDYWTNVEATETLEVPARLLVLGGGPVGCELAQFFQRVGSQVTLVQGDTRLLSRVDADAAALVEEALREDGVDVRLGAQAQRVSADRLFLADGGEVEFDRLLVATGRRANVGGLDALGLEITRRGIEVDERLRAAENVWAIGDVTGIAPFTHVGKYHARIVAYDMAGRDARADHRAIPATIFTDPQVAMVGDTQGGVSSTWSLQSVPRLSTYERPKRPGFVKVVADPERRVLKGAVAAGPESGEWLQQLTLAIRAETPVEVLLDVIQPYPTFSEGVFFALRELNLDL